MKNFAAISLFLGLIGTSFAANIGLQHHDLTSFQPITAQDAQVAQARSPAVAQEAREAEAQPQPTYSPTYNAEARTPVATQAYRIKHVTPSEQPQVGLNPVYASQTQQQPHLTVSVSAYKPQQTEQILLDDQKQKTIEKKPIPGVKDVKPAYYPKDSSYSSVPVPHSEPATARFVADPSRGQIVEEISPIEYQQLSMQQARPYSVVSQPMQMPGHNFNYVAAVPGGRHPGMVHGMVPLRAVQAGGPQFYNAIQSPGKKKTQTVTYEKTEHGFIDRVWGEVQTMRQAITTDFFGAVPNFFRNIWDAIVTAVSPSTARMLSSLNWVEIGRFVIEQFS